MDDEDTVEKRRQRSDDARRAAMKQKIQQQKERDRQIATDIANVDKKATKRIVFADSDEDNEVEEVSDITEKTTLSGGSKRPRLFDSEGEEEEDDGKEFEIKNRHSGPKGELLMQMESRFNSDPRFKLDDKFAESDSDDDGKEEGDAEKQEMKMEKDKNRELLSKILGKSVEEKKPKTAETSTLKARPFTRFDPENPEHLAWMREFEASKNPQQSKKSAESEEKAKISDEEDDEGDSEKEKTKEGDGKEEESDDDNFEKAEIFFKMDEKFSAEMKERKDTGESGGTGGGFSFLSMMGRKYEDEPEEEDDDIIEEEPAKISKKKSEGVEKIDKSLLKVKVSTKFFIDPLSDEKIKSMASNFRRTQTVEKIIDKWAPHRDAIFKLWKKQRRDAVKKQKESFFTNGKRKRKADDENEEAAVKA